MKIIDDWDSLRKHIYNNMQLKTTDELRSILEEHDREAWSDAAFEVVREILIRRTGEAIQDPLEQVSSPARLDQWKSINWKKIYRRSQRQLERRLKFALAGLAIFSLMSLYFLLPVTHLPLPLIAILIILFLGFLGWVTWLMVRRPKENRLVLEARIHLKSISLLRNNYNIAEINVLNAFAVTPDGQILEVKDWSGHRKVLFPLELFAHIDENDKVNLLCRSGGTVLGRVEDYLDT
jgi:hypothetical protein